MVRYEPLPETMPEAFDNIAATYDSGFVDTLTGKMQREIVWRYLEDILDDKKELSILELNCGTGEDAIWFASKGHNVFATDISEKMLKVAELKAEKAGVKNNMNFQRLDISKPEIYGQLGSFDLVFSNFGGFNCISPETFHKISPAISKLLNPDGHFIAVVMSKCCLWESFYYSLKGRPKSAFRRSRKGPLKVMIGQSPVDTWYYSPSETERLNEDFFVKVAKRPVGFFLPPSYLDNFFKKHPGMLRMLFRLEKSFRNIATTAGVSDHFLIDMEAKK